MPSPHARPDAEVQAGLQSTPNGLGQAEAVTRLNTTDTTPCPRPGIVRVFLHQFASPLIYVLAVAALVSRLTQEWSDAGFICAVLLNAIIGTAREYSAQRPATALQVC